MLPDQPEGELRVRVVRDSEGKVIGFQDPDRGNRFISRADAIRRLEYSVERGAILDSFGNPVGVGALHTPGSGYSVTYATKEATYTPIGVSPLEFRPNANQEVIERTVFVAQDGSLVATETSYGIGRPYDPHKFGGRWRRAASEALGLGANERLPTADLQRAVAWQEYQVKTID